MNSVLYESFFSWRKIVTAVLVLLVSFTVLFIATRDTDNAYAISEGHLITIHDRGVEKIILSNADTVAGALEEADINIDEKDLIEPGLDEQIVAPEYHVNIYRARPVTIVEGNTRQTIITAYQTPQQIAKEAKITLYPEDNAKIDRIDDVTRGFGEQLVIKRATRFAFTIYGKTSTVRTQAKTVSEMLTEKGIKLEGDDRVFPGLSNAIEKDLKVKLWREGKQTITVEETVPFEIEVIEDANKSYQYHQIKTPGEKGTRSVVYEVVIVDGKESSKKEIASVIIKQPKKQVEVKGIMGKYTTPGENESITWDYLIKQGFSRVQTAGIMGNLMQEHGFKTSDASGGLGIAQWTGSRRANLLARANWDNIYVQLDFLMSELNSGYINAKNQILATSSLVESVRIFQNQFERCGICMEDRRIYYAQNILASH